MIHPTERPFLTAEWRNLIMLNYEVEPSLLRRHVPGSTQLDSWNGRTYISLVGFLFANTRVLNVNIPWHRTFEEVNLRFYVRREVTGEVRRAVTFIRELVPRRAIALVARLAYNEPYVAVPMRHCFGDPDNDAIPRSIEYQWRLRDGWSSLRAAPSGIGAVPSIGSHEEYITEHYWGYTRQRDGSTVEYRVMHAPWRVWSATTWGISGPIAALYGQEIADILDGTPASAFVADGSPVTVYAPARLTK